LKTEESEMTAVSDESLLARFKGNPGATRSLIDICRSKLNFTFPPDYTGFLQRMNGGQGFLGEHFLKLSPVEEFVEINTDSYYAQTVPELLIFGSNGAGEAFAFDTRSAPPSIVVVPFIGMDFENAILIAANFNAFLQFLYRSDDLF
jgi:hypothetical protein